MKQVINRKSYDTNTSEFICKDKDWDGLNFYRNGRSTSLYKTKKGQFFFFHETRWQGEFNSIELIDISNAIDFAELNNCAEIDFSAVFGISIEEG
jgi:hypothetical protein